MKTFCFVITYFLLTAFDNNSQQRDEISYYRPDIGMYFTYNKKEGRKKIPFRENWDFYFNLRNDTVAIIQEIKNKVVLAQKAYVVSLSVDTGYVKRYSSGKHYKTEKFYFRKIEM
jgi:hypothetical protein